MVHMQQQQQTCFTVFIAMAKLSSILLRICEGLRNKTAELRLSSNSNGFTAMSVAPFASSCDEQLFEPAVFSGYYGTGVMKIKQHFQHTGALGGVASIYMCG